MQNTISKNIGGLILILVVLSMISCGKKEPSAWELSAEFTRLYKGKQYEEAKEVGKNFLEKYPDDERAASVQLKLASAYYRLKDFDQAREEYEKVVQKYPLKSEEAQRTVDFIKEHSDFNYQPLKMYVDIQNTSDPQGRIKGLKEMLKRYPDCNLADDVQYSIGRTYMLLGQYPEAKKEFDILLYDLFYFLKHCGTQNENGRFDSFSSEKKGFGRRGYAKIIYSFLLQGPWNLDHPMAIALGLDDGHDSNIWTYFFLNLLKVMD